MGDLIFALDETRDYGGRLAGALGLELGVLGQRRLPDAEPLFRLPAGISGNRVLLVQTLHGGGDAGDPDGRLARLLLALSALRDERPAALVAVIPYLAGSRHDHRGERREPLMLQHVAGLIESAGADAVFTLEVHQPGAFENAFRIPAIDVPLDGLWVDHLRGKISLGRHLVAVSPDSGGLKRAQSLARQLEQVSGHRVPLAWVDKQRLEAGSESHELIGEVGGRTVLLVDDLLSTGQTLARAASLCRQKGARSVVALCGHGLFCQGAAQLLSGQAIDRLVVTDSVPQPEIRSEPSDRGWTVLGSAEVLARAIGPALDALFRDGNTPADRFSASGPFGRRRSPHPRAGRLA